MKCVLNTSFDGFPQCLLVWLQVPCLEKVILKQTQQGFLIQLLDLNPITSYSVGLDNWISRAIFISS